MKIKEIEESLYWLLEEGNKLLEDPELPRDAYLNTARSLLKNYGIKEDDTLLTILDKLNTLLKSPDQEAVLPPKEIIEKSLEDLNEHQQKVAATRQHATQSTKIIKETAVAQKLRQEAVNQTLIATKQAEKNKTIFPAPPPPTPTINEPPIAAIPPDIVKAAGDMVRAVNRESGNVFTPNQIDLIIRKTYSASFPKSEVPVEIDKTIDTRLTQTLEQTPVLKNHPLGEETLATLKDLAYRQPPEYQETIAEIIKQTTQITTEQAQQATGEIITAVKPAQDWIQESGVIVPLAQIAQQAVTTTPSVPEELKTDLEAEIKQALTKQYPTLTPAQAQQATAEIAQAVILNTASPSPQRTLDLKNTVQETLQDNGVVFTPKEQLTSFVKEVVELAPVAPIANWVTAETKSAGIIAKPETKIDQASLQRQLDETVKIIFDDHPQISKAGLEQKQIASQKVSEILVAHTLSPVQKETSTLVAPVKKIFEEQGIGLKTEEVKVILNRIENNANPILVNLQKIDKPIPEEIFTKIDVQPPRANPIRRFVSGAERTISAPLARTIIKADGKTAEWQEISEGKFGERYLESARILKEAGMPKDHPTIVKLEEKGQRLLRTQQENGKDKPATAILKRFYQSSRQPIFDKELGIHLPRQIVSKIPVSRFSFENKLVSFVTRGRFSSFGAVQNSLFQKSFGKIGSTLAKSPLAQGLFKSVAGKLGVQIAGKGLVGALAASGVVTGGVGTLLAAAITVLPSLAKKLRLNTKIAGALAAGGMMLGGLISLGAGFAPILGVGLIAIGAGSLAMMAPGLGVGLGGAVGGIVSGVSSIFSGIAGMASAAPIGAGVIAGTVSINMIAFIIIMIAAGAFMIPGGGGGTYFPWTGYATQCPASFPKPSLPTGTVFSWPVPNALTCASAFGHRLDPFGSGECRCHTGIDIQAGNNVPVVAVADGKVYRINYNPNIFDSSSTYGFYVVIDHQNGLFSLYAHLNRPDLGLALNQPIVKGDRLGFVGESGHVTGPHLHFSFGTCGSVENSCFSNGNYTPDPCEYLPGCDPSCRYKDRVAGCSVTRP